MYRQQIIVGRSIFKMLRPIVALALVLQMPSFVRAQVTVDATGTVGQYTSLAVNTVASTLHISYYDATYGDLKHAWKPIAGGAWVREIVDSIGNVGQHTSIAADPSGGLHISYYAVSSSTGATLANLRYAYKPLGGAWALTTVDWPGTVGQYSSIVVNSAAGAGTVHISYYDATGGNLKHTWKPIVGGTWTPPEIVDAPGNVGQHTSIAAGPTGTVHISYYSVTSVAGTATQDLKHAWKPLGGGWALPETVDAFGNAGQYTSIAVDPSGKVHISYYWASQGDLKYVRKTISGWTLPEAVDAVENVGLYTSIAVNNAACMLHISYYDATNGNLKQISKPLYFGTWAPPVIVDAVGTVGQYTSIEADPAGSTHISCYKVTGGDLRYYGPFGPFTCPTSTEAEHLAQKGTSGIDKSGEQLSPPLAYGLAQNYPNPFNPSTTIEFALKQAGGVTLKVYNSLGQEVATLLNEQLSAGRYSAIFDATGLPSGVYFYRLSVNGFSEVKKMKLVK